MDILFLLVGFLLVVIGVAGSFLPIIPGPLCGWLGLLLIHLTSVVTMDWTFLGITLSVAILIFILDYFIPIWGTKRFGGTMCFTQDGFCYFCGYGIGTTA